MIQPEQFHVHPHTDLCRTLPLDPQPELLSAAQPSKMPPIAFVDSAVCVELNEAV